MQITNTQALVIILVTAFATVITRFVPFILFPEGREYPKIITYLGRVLPPAMMGLLVIYCLKNTSLIKPPHAIPEIASIAAVALIHIWKRNVLLSIAVGTALYMFLVQCIF